MIQCRDCPPKIKKESPTSFCRIARRKKCLFFLEKDRKMVQILKNYGGSKILRDAAFLLTFGSFLLTVELSYLQLTSLAFLLTIGAFWLTVGKCF